MNSIVSIVAKRDLWFHFRWTMAVAWKKKLRSKTSSKRLKTWLVFTNNVNPRYHLIKMSPMSVKTLRERSFSTIRFKRILFLSCFIQRSQLMQYSAFKLSQLLCLFFRFFFNIFLLIEYSKKSERNDYGVPQSKRCQNLERLITLVIYLKWWLFQVLFMGDKTRIFHYFRAAILFFSIPLQQCRLSNLKTRSVAKLNDSSAQLSIL